MSAFATIAAGLALSKALGRDVSEGQANWMAASYLYLNPFLYSCSFPRLKAHRNL